MANQPLRPLSSIKRVPPSVRSRTSRRQRAISVINAFATRERSPGQMIHTYAIRRIEEIVASGTKSQNRQEFNCLVRIVRIYISERKKFLNRKLSILKRGKENVPPQLNFSS